MTLAASQVFHAVGMRDITRSVFRMNHKANKMMLLSIALALALQFSLTEIPVFTRLFGTVSLGLTGWLTVLGFSLVPMLAHEIVVLIRGAAGK
jgi:Ca2+-transporting ATPase